MTHKYIFFNTLLLGIAFIGMLCFFLTESKQDNNYGYACMFVLTIGSPILIILENKRIRQ